MAESKTSFSIACRYYRLHPYPASKMLGYGEKVLKLPIEETALIAIHCWNINFPDGPQVIPQFNVCSGWAEYIDRAREIIEHKIQPVLESARSAAIPMATESAPSAIDLAASAPLRIPPEMIKETFPYRPNSLKASRASTIAGTVGMPL